MAKTMQWPKRLLNRNLKSNKNHFGHVLILAGSSSMLGAAALCALAAMRSGAGLVTAAVAKSLNLTLQKKISPVIMTFPLPETSQGVVASKAYPFLKERFHKYQAMAIGPGLGLSVSTQRLIQMIVEKCPLPMVVDADALNAVAKKMQLLKAIQGSRILTPHSGEMSRLTGLTVAFIEAHRKKVALGFAKQSGCVILLKGHCTVVASPSGQVFVNSTGNPGLATAGSGDVLTGMIVALLAQGVEPFKAACLGAKAHGAAGDCAAKEKGQAGLIASDVIEYIPKALRSYEN